MNFKEISFGVSARQKILLGTTKLSDAVRTTLSSKGQNVVIEEGMSPPKIINDGVSIAKAIQFKDHYENVGALLMIQAAEKTNQAAGDGTTTAIILAQEIYSRGLKYLVSGVNQMSIKHGVKVAVNAVIKELRKLAKPIKRFEDIKNIATVSSGDNELGQVIAEAIDAVGKDGVVTVEEWSGFRLEKEIVKGTQIARGFASPYFVTNEKNYNAVLKDPLFFITSYSLENVDHIFGAMKVARENKRSLVVIAPDIRAQALYTLAINVKTGQLSSVAVQAPGAGDEQEEELEDLAALVGATCISDKSGVDLEKIELKHLGSADKIISDKNTTTIIGGGGKKSAIQRRITALKALLKDPNSQYKKEQYRARLGRLTGKVAIIKVGAPTTPEIEDKKLKLEDALNATRSAIDEGILPGGGKALYLAKDCLDKIKLNEEEQIGVEIVKQAITAPIQQVITNSGKSVDRYLVQIENAPKTFGFNSDTGQVEDLLKAGVVDSLKVVRCALENAGSVSAMLLTTNAVITEELKEEDK